MRISPVRKGGYKGAPPWAVCAHVSPNHLQKSSGAGEFFRGLGRRLLDAAESAKKKAIAEVTDYLHFMPEKILVSRPQQFGAACEEVELTTADGLKLHAWFVPAVGRRRRQSILHFHGNKGNLGDQAAFHAALSRNGYSVFSVDYRGYGMSGGTPSESGFYHDSLAAYEAMLKIDGVAPDQIVIWGTSLGGAVAIELATRVKHAALVAESTFTHTADVLACRLPEKMALPNEWVARRFDSLSRIARIVTPKLFIHGDADLVIPKSLGEKLASAAGEPKRFFAVPGAGHTDLKQMAGDKLLQELEKVLDGLPVDGSTHNSQ